MINIRTSASGVLAAWIRRPGDAVEQGDPLAIVECHDGHYVFVESPHDGTLAELAVEGGMAVEPDASLAQLHVPARALALA